MWFLFSTLAAIFWGISYAASGRVLERGMSPLVFFAFYAGTGFAVALLALLFAGKFGAVSTELAAIGSDWRWLAISCVTIAIGALLMYFGIGGKNATLASLVEISYPVFTALFAWVFFRDVQFNLAAVVGGAMVLGGVVIVYLGNRH